MQIQGMMGGMDMAAMREMRAAMFAKADGDKSGGLSLEEFTKTAETGPMAKMAKMSGAPGIGEMFSAMDADGDGSVTAAEMDSMKPPQSMMSGDTMSALLSLQGLDTSSNSQGGQAFDPDQAVSDLLTQALEAFSAKSKSEEDTKASDRFDLAA